MLSRKKSLKKPKGQTESVNRRTENTMTKRKTRQKIENDLQNTILCSYIELTLLSACFNFCSDGLFIFLAFLKFLQSCNICILY